MNVSLTKFMDGKELRIVFMGTPEFAVEPLRALVCGGYNVVGVVTAPDKPAGRGLNVQESAVKKFAAGAGLPVLQPVKLKDPEFMEALRALDADLAIVVAFRMLPEAVWSMPRLGTFNLHASLLPQYRGAAPINRAIINGESVTGVTTFFLNRNIDEGDIIDRRRMDILPEDTAGTLHDKLMYAGTELVLESVDKIAAGDYILEKQDSIPAETLKAAPKIFRETCHVDFSKTCREVVDLIRGLSPYPAAWADMVRCDGVGADSFPVKIYSVGNIHTANGNSGRPGSIVTDGKDFMRVVCGDGLIEIGELQPAGKKKMTVREFLRGFRDAGAYRFE